MKVFTTIAHRSEEGRKESEAWAEEARGCTYTNSAKIGAYDSLLLLVASAWGWAVETNSKVNLTRDPD